MENIESLFIAAKANDMLVFVSPHYYFPADHGWQFEGALEKLMHNIGMFDHYGALGALEFSAVRDSPDWWNRIPDRAAFADAVLGIHRQQGIRSDRSEEHSSR